MRAGADSQEGLAHPFLPPDAEICKMRTDPSIPSVRGNSPIRFLNFKWFAPSRFCFHFPCDHQECKAKVDHLIFSRSEHEGSSTVSLELSFVLLSIDQTDRLLLSMRKPPICLDIFLRLKSRQVCLYPRVDPSLKHSKSRGMLFENGIRIRYRKWMISSNVKTVIATSLDTLSIDIKTCEW